MVCIGTAMLRVGTAHDFLLRKIFGVSDSAISIAPGLHTQYRAIREERCDPDMSPKM